MDEFKIPNHSFEKEAQLAQDEKTQFLKAVLDQNTRGARGFQTSLRYGAFRDFDFVYLIEPLIWEWEPKHEWKLPNITKVEAVENFVTDLTSVPRVFWQVIPRHGPYAHAAVIHDYLYWRQSLDGVEVSRETADRILRLGMDDMNVSSAKAATIYHAVRWFGGWAWDRNKELRDSGERRLLARRPDRPEISWEEWKADKSNFGAW